MVAESIVDFLDSEGVATKGTDIFLGSQPDSPDNCITLYDESAPTLEESDAFNIDTGGVQVMVRNTDYLTAKATLTTIHQKVSGFRHGKFVASGPWIRQTHITTPPSSIGKDEDDRHEWVVHYSFEYESTGNDNRSST